MNYRHVWLICPCLLYLKEEKIFCPKGVKRTSKWKWKKPMVMMGGERNKET